jgi:glycosyltransferase involved in cell wall biosynthesis
MNKICFIIDNLKIAGTQKHLLRLVDGLASKGYSTEIISLGVNDGNLIKDIDAPITYFKMDYIWQPRFWLDFVRLVRFLSKNKPYIVHTYLNTSNVFGVLAAKIAQISIIISSRRDLGQFRSNFIGEIESFTARLSNKVICASEAIRQNVALRERVDLKKISIINNGVASQLPLDYKTSELLIKETLGISHKDSVVGIIGSLFCIKGHGDFIEAARLVLNEIPDVKFLIVGAGPLRNSLESVVHNQQLEEKIEFLGQRNDISELLSIMDVSANASYSEGMSNTILESMAVGVPVVATAVDGNLETVVNGETGLLVPPRNPQAMAKAIIRILKDKDLAVKMGQNARKLVEEKFSLERMTQNYSILYDKLINPKRVGYVVSLFPCWSETFILNEIIELEKRGFDITIFSIRKDLEEFTQDKAKQLLKNTRYVYSSKVIVASLYWLLKRPLVFISLIFIVLNQRYSLIREALKNIYVFFSGCYFASIVKNERLTHIHAHFATYPALAALVMSKLTNIPFTFTAHAHDIFLEKTLLKEKARAAKAIIAISDYNKRYVSDYCQNGIYSKMKVIHCGLDLPEFVNFNGKPKENLILSIGRLTKMKGFEYLIKACSRLKNQIPIQCRIIGDGPLRDELERLIINLGVRGCVRLEGVMDNNKIKQLLQSSSAFVLPSVWDEQDGQDGIPVVLMEAMASGIPVVSSNISGIPELVEDGKTGLLAEPSNVEQLSQKILQLLSDKELQTRLAEAGRRKVEEEFDVVKSVEKLVGVFSDAN